jgi:hypothetical protein
MPLTGMVCPDREQSRPRPAFTSMLLLTSKLARRVALGTSLSQPTPEIEPLRWIFEKSRWGWIAPMPEQGAELAVALDAPATVAGMSNSRTGATSVTGTDSRWTVVSRAEVVDLVTLASTPRGRRSDGAMETIFPGRRAGARGKTRPLG